MNVEINALTGYYVAQVYLLDAPYGIDKRYEYFIPGELRGAITVGSFVILPFGGGNRRCHALVVGLADESEYPIDKLKPVLGVSGNITLNSEQIELCEFMHEFTFCTIGDAIRAMLPSAALSGLNERFAINPEYPKDGIKNLSQHAISAFYLILRLKKVTFSALETEIGAKTTAALNELIKGNYIKSISVSATERYTTFVSIALEDDELEEVVSGSQRLRGQRQINIVETLRERGRLTLDELRMLTGCTQSQLTTLEGRGIIVTEKVDSYRNPYNETPPPPDENILNKEQIAAASRICEMFSYGCPKAVLLHGVTGSGKTRVIIDVIQHVITSGREAIMLIPEIALTPQTVMLFRSYFGDKVTVLHSALSSGERYDAWRRIRNGEVSICVGTRSAIFAPFNNLGLIIIDEEQENSYKSDMKPRYHARDIARFRCGKHNAVMLLSSATPSLESYKKALEGKYELIELSERYGNAVLPSTELYDMRVETRAGNISPIGTRLREEIQKNLDAGEQTILFLNRRGYNYMLSCIMCGEVLMCPHCSVALTYHITKSGGYLMCHYCGHKQDKPSLCPSCGSEHISHMGYGTQKLEEEIEDLFPQARIIRMDSDTTGTKFAYDELLERFREQEGDILLGTQMVVKGHDFPNVSLVGVINADMSLYIDDFRANEQTFNLITQVSGRAGRGNIPGRVVIQTFSPDNEVLKLASEQNYKAFYNSESALRNSLTFPPYCDIMMVTMSCENENELLVAMDAYAKRLKYLFEHDYQDVPVVIFGPFEAPVYMHNGRYRYRLIIKCRVIKRLRELMSQMMIEFSSNAYKRITTVYDINPTGM